eukprot:CAMPEP_0170284272 /NCGR_PEP_ID=MMETSP0116_2-20130129/42173_1 /TAXON_ID=400756 /ORGANISM="Durinskia baltica, Strain CSIRO CS-38" /LENGTH=92 /DNA_ID=CAMNT_0010535649 /DNA_START=17 /DNA_END=292 /DNA_ORIENTATION=+
MSRTSAQVPGSGPEEENSPVKCERQPAPPSAPCRSTAEARRDAGKTGGKNGIVRMRECQAEAKGEGAATRARNPRPEFRTVVANPCGQAVAL